YLKGYRGFESLLFRHLLVPGNPEKSRTSNEAPVNAGVFVFYVPLRYSRSQHSLGVLLGVLCFSGGGIFENGSFEGTMALTDSQIKKAKSSEKAYRMIDSGGMYLWVTPSGGKLWRWGYRFGGKEKLMALGKYPGV